MVRRQTQRSSRRIQSRGNLGRLRGEHQRRLSLDGLRRTLFGTSGHQAETHRGLLTLFSLVLVKTGKFEKKWGKFLANLKDDREAGDYEALSYLDEQTASRALTEAEEFVGKVEVFLGQRDG